MAQIDIVGVSKRFGDHLAVDSLDLAIADGELLVFLGPSGCGKSTTMNMIAGLTPIDSGSIRFDNRDVSAIEPHSRNVAMVFQSSLLYPHLSIRRNIAMSLRRSSLPKVEATRRIEEAARSVNIFHLLEKLPSQVSGGERQRAATAKAIVRRPSVFLLDEPLSALDAALRLDLRAELVNLQKRLATTMVFVTHDQTEAMTMGDRIAVMHAGRIEQIGTPNEVYAFPSTLFVAGFVGSPPMNFFGGAIASEDGPSLKAGPMSIAVPHSPAAVDAMSPGQEVVAAVRPQHVRASREAIENSFPASVFALEKLGRESVLILASKDFGTVRLLVDPHADFKVGEVVHGLFDPADVLFYDKRSGNRIAT
ncbi:ABC transporter ATP-binding protein [Mesorhizobium sp. M3A.F.Ca.ET.201.01.1.1]|uniref:ABC transporter ATP-binding protein n=1 Tax=Mesorhizobium sp. M3A.F.Ca.ET.201.01.1.1 TaxID=2563946 RepID=UPI001093D789|nr:ABC transporter ATP-binding protein [Mesorhizobium sp. M3A.F.Ca.ET.201.01.1.1]TGS71736.1 ABC transporter ATP-binding protein [Mesorhizobium sp. M3A.F.Ca.ET.201.01.1.1]